MRHLYYPYFLLCLLLTCAVAAPAQTLGCCDKLRQAGIESYNKGDYADAIKKWEAAKTCATKCKTDDLDSWIRKAKEEIAWNRAKEENTKSAYQEYLKKYPKGKYAAQAEAKINPPKKVVVPPKPKPKPNSSNSTQSQVPPSGVRGLEREMVFVKGGYFNMGSNDYDNEKPIHGVTLSDFYIGKYEVTNEQFCHFINDKGNQIEGGETWLEMSEYVLIERKNGQFAPKAGYANHPVIEVSWYGATAYAKWLREQTGKKYRLPTEAEWEYGARGGRQTNDYKYAGSNNVDEVAWYLVHYQLRR
jgi:formylglycine-generating enzyme required for sulfatase activity